MSNSIKKISRETVFRQVTCSGKALFKKGLGVFMSSKTEFPVGRLVQMTSEGLALGELRSKSIIGAIDASGSIIVDGSKFISKGLVKVEAACFVTKGDPVISFSEGRVGPLPSPNNLGEAIFEVSNITAYNSHPANGPIKISSSSGNDKQLVTYYCIMHDTSLRILNVQLNGTSIVSTIQQDIEYLMGVELSSPAEGTIIFTNAAGTEIGTIAPTKSASAIYKPQPDVRYESKPNEITNPDKSTGYGMQVYFGCDPGDVDVPLGLIMDSPNGQDELITLQMNNVDGVYLTEDVERLSKMFTGAMVGVNDVWSETEHRSPQKFVGLDAQIGVALSDGGKGQLIDVLLTV